MTRRPPDRIPGAAAGPPERDPARERYLDGFLRALVRRDRARKAIEREFAADCARLREEFREAARARRPARAAPGRDVWHQATLEESGIINTGPANRAVNRAGSLP